MRGQDCAASLKRWAAKIVGAQVLASRIASVEESDDKSFVIRLKTKYPSMIETLANSDQPLFIMRKQEAETDPNRPVNNVVGSGPFLFKADEWQPGNRVVYVKNPAYKPRPEPADGYAGGKVVHVDRVEWIYTPDPGTAAQALIAGQMDIYELPPNDLLPLLDAAPNVRTEIVNRLGSEAILRPNSLVPPFDNPKVRQALLYAVDQQESLAAIDGQPSLGKPCWEVFVCGTPLGVTAGLGDFAKTTASPARARALLKEAGYKGERVVMINPTDQALVTALVSVNAANLRKAGFNVDVQNMDWATMISRRPIKDSPEKNPSGWNIFFTWTPSTFWANPLVNNAIATQCDDSNWFGWPCDQELEKLHEAFFDVAPGSAEKALAEQFQTRFYKVVPYVPLGLYFSKVAFSKRVTGLLRVPRLVMWNVDITSA